MQASGILNLTSKIKPSDTYREKFTYFKIIEISGMYLFVNNYRIDVFYSRSSLILKLDNINHSQVCRLLCSARKQFKILYLYLIVRFVQFITATDIS